MAFHNENYIAKTIMNVDDQGNLRKIATYNEEGFLIWLVKLPWLWSLRNCAWPKS